ncbi:SDR family oxidoreductase [Paracidobacterium acidisoli]|uniref:SDR family oxidoreductase n=1 Tax=Paracidobacterium acidisoli TaxID=2303751 RepID=A0A372IU00_9BACT|nr:SDR family oxidoreductase [Paracidobacterium acidisoli]MBT9329851.1 SDR family oxidoreductase [Paracidobacterium acidisoli]
MGELKGQVAVVTGAGRGIGEAIAQRLASMGAAVVLAARSVEDLNRVRGSITAAGGEAEAAAADLQKESSIAALAEMVRQRYGRCDILVNNAGVGKIGRPLHEMAPEDWETVMSTNLRGPYLTIRAFAPLMIAARSGHIVNISSLAGHNPLKNGAAYAASKWGLNGLTYSVAEELREYGIRVSVVAPGSVNTKFGGGAAEHGERKIQPVDIAHVVAMLVTQSPQSFVSEVLVRPTRKA